MPSGGGATTGGPCSADRAGKGAGDRAGAPVRGSRAGSGRRASPAAPAPVVGASRVRLPGSPGRGALERAGPRGRHGFPLDQVAAFRRVRLLDEFVAHVGRSGFADTHVSQVCRAAGASTKAFYDAFGSKDQCLLRAFDLGAALVCEQALAAFEAAPGGWRARVLAAVEAALEVLAANPPFARVALVEVPRLGPAGVARLDAVVARFLARLGATPGAGAPATEMPAAKGVGCRNALVAAAVCLLAGRVEAGEAGRLAELAPAVVGWWPGETGSRARTGLVARNIQARNEARSFSSAPAVVQLGASPDDAQ